MIRKAFFNIVAALLTLPMFTFAAGQVPCGDVGERPCEFCHVGILANNVVDWLVGILSVLVAVILVVAGIRLATSAGNVMPRNLPRA